MDKLNPPSAVHQLPAAPSSTPSQSLTPSSPDAVQAERLRKINRMVGRLFSAYPKTDYDDPKSALAMMVHVLSGYPLRIVDQLTNLTTGMQLKYKFPPRLAEIKTEAEAVVAAERAVEEQRNRRRAERERIEKQIEERVALDRARPDRPTVADLKAKYGPTYGIDPDGGDRKPVENNFKAPTWDELRDYYAANPDRITKLTGQPGTR